MADSKITALTAISTVDPAADPLVIVDVSDTSMAASGTTKKATINQLLGASGTATLASATITGNLTVDTNTLFVDSANNRVGIGTASPTEALEVSNGGNIKIGGFDQCILGAGGGGAKMQFSNGANDLDLFGGSTGRVRLYTASTERYRIASDGVATWSNVGGVAGTAMTLNSTGLGVGTIPGGSTGSSKIAVVGGATYDGNFDIIANFTNSTASAAKGVLLGYNNSTNNGIISAAYGSGTEGLTFWTHNGSSWGQRMELTATGNVGIGVTPSAWGSTYRALQIGLGTSLTGVTNDVDVNLVNNARFDGTNWKYTNTSPAERYRTAAGTHYWYNAASGTAGNNITWTQAMTLESTGSLVLGAAAVATTATDGFLYIPGCAGTPTGTPTAKTGRVPLVVDTTNNKLYFYSGGAWVAAN